MLRSIFFLSTISILVSCYKRNTEISTGNFAPRLDSLFSAVPDFSGTVLIADKGRPFYHKAFGYSDFENKTRLDTNSIFELASLSKQFTSMIIMMLKEKAMLSYDDQIEKYFPDFPYKGITIRNLLNHTSGLPDYQAVMDEHWDKAKVANNNDNIEYLIRYKPEKHFQPGEKYEYSNTGYMLLASIAEKASGKDFIELCRENIFRPIGMAGTDIRTKTDKMKLPNMAWGHLYVKEKQRYIHADSFPEFNYAIWLGNRKGPGRVSSTTRDLLKWDRGLHANQLIRNTTLSEAFAPATLNDGSLSNYGFGWSIRQDNLLGKIVYHTGNNPGYKTIICRYLDSDKTIIMLCNNGHSEFDNLFAGIEAILFAVRNESPGK